MRSTLPCLCFAFALSAFGCGSEGGEQRSFPDLPDGQIPDRRGAVILVGCSLDAWQTETLAAPETQRVVKEVVLLCLQADADGHVAPGDLETTGDVRSLVASLHDEGYAVFLGVEPGDFLDTPYGAAQNAMLLASATWRASVVTELSAWSSWVDGFELALSPVPDSSRDDVTAFVTAVAQMPAKHGTVSVFLPPLTTEPTDVPGGDAFDVASLSSVADRFRLMTLDYSANSSAGPTIDTGWAVDAYRFAASRTSLPIDVSLPLYGTDFSDLGERSVTYLEAMGAAATFGAPVSRGPTGAPHVAYTDADGHAHDVWFDDAYSTILELDALGPSTLPPAVGVTFYGLGAEDPALFSSLAARLP